MAALGTLLAFTVELSREPTFTRLAQLKGLANSSGILAAICDVTIAAILIYFLIQSRRGFSRSDTIIRKLIAFTLSTGLLTSLCALCTIIALSLAPTKLIYGFFFANLSKLYSNSLFATLNARDAIQERSTFRTDGTSLGHHVAKGHPEHPENDSLRQGVSHAAISVHQNILPVPTTKCHAPV